MATRTLAATVALLAAAALLPGPARAERADDVERLLAALTEGSEGARAQAASRLFLVGAADRGVPRLASRLRHEDPLERCLAAQLLGLLRSARGVAPLVAALDDADWAVRRDAAEALGQIGDRAAEGPLARRLGDEHPRVRAAAARALGELGATAALPRALGQERDPEVRLHMVEAMGPGAPGRRALALALADEAESVRLLAAARLVELGDARGVAVLGERLGAGLSEAARGEAATALGRATGRAVEAAARALSRGLTDPSPEVGLLSAAALAALGDPRGPQVLRSLADGDAPPGLRARALALLEGAAGE